MDGGAAGRDTISRFLEELKYHLSPRGRALLLVSSFTGLNEVKEKARSEGLEIIEVARKGYFFEQLYVIRLRVAQSLNNRAENPI